MKVDTSIIIDFSETNLNNHGKSSGSAKNNNYMCDNQVYGLTTEIEPI